MADSKKTQDEAEREETADRAAANQDAADREATDREATNREATRGASSSRVRALAVIGARGIVGIVGVGIAAVTVIAATLIPLPHLGVEVASQVVNPVAAPQQRICAGPVLQLGDDVGQDATTAISLGRAEVTRAATSGEPVLEDMDATENESNVPSQRLILTPSIAGDEVGLLAGSQSQSLNSAGIAGFAASDCVKPSAESWLVGGSTLTGRTTLLSLNNPSKVSATVKLSVYSEQGTVDAAGADGIIVPPGGRRVFSLAAFAPGVASAVVHVESAGGQVTAALQQSIVRTLTPGGIDLSTAVSAPSTLTVIPGVVFVGHSEIAAASSVGGYGDLAGALRVFMPGKGSSEIRVSAVPEDGSSAGHSSTLTVEGGMVTDFSLGEFADGSWTLTIESDKPLVAAARTSTVTLQGVAADTTVTPVTSENIVAADVAWFAGAPSFGPRSLVSVAAGPSPMLHLVNTGTTDTTVSVDEVNGAKQSVTVAAGKALAVPVVSGSSYLLSYPRGTHASVSASVSYQGSGAIAGFAVNPPERGIQPVTVFTEHF